MFADKKLAAFLKNHNVAYNLHKHPAVFTVKEAKKIDKKIPGLATKNLFLKDRKTGQFYLVTMNAYKKLDIKKLQKTLGVKKLSFGSAEELSKELKVKPGSVSMLAIIHAENTGLILDKEVWEAPIAGFHPNINTATLEIDHENLEKFLKAIGFKKENILKL